MEVIIITQRDKVNWLIIIIMTALKKTSADDKQPGTPPWHQTDEQVKLWAVIWQCFKTKQSFIFLTYVDIMIPTLKCHKKTNEICCFIFKLFHVWIMKSWNKISVKICDCDFWEVYFSLEKKNQNKQCNWNVTNSFFMVFANMFTHLDFFDFEKKLCIQQTNNRKWL